MAMHGRRPVVFSTLVLGPGRLCGGHTIFYCGRTGGSGSLSQLTRVVILQSDKLLNAGVQSLLSTKADVEVIGIAHSDESYASILERTQPDIVIMDENVLCANMSAYLYPEMRTIVLSLGDNQMQVYDRRIIEVDHLNDFLDLL
jgi:hypothetical protein